MATKIFNRQIVPKSIQIQNSLNQNAQSFVAVAKTTGTTPVNLFGTGGVPANLTITGVFVGAQDTTAGNITVVTAGGTVATVAKGTTIAAMTSVSSALANTKAAAGSALTVASSSAGNALVYVFYTFDAE